MIWIEKPFPRTGEFARLWAEVGTAPLRLGWQAERKETGPDKGASTGQCLCQRLRSPLPLQEPRAVVEKGHRCEGINLLQRLAPYTLPGPFQNPPAKPEPAAQAGRNGASWFSATPLPVQRVLSLFSTFQHVGRMAGFLRAL